MTATTRTAEPRHHGTLSRDPYATVTLSVGGETLRFHRIHAHAVAGPLPYGTRLLLRSLLYHCRPCQTVPVFVRESSLVALRRAARTLAGLSSK